MALALAPHRLLRLAGALTTPLLPGDYLRLVDPLRGSREVRGRVDAVRRETARASTLVISPGPGFRPHLAGQWVRIGVQIDGVWHSRSYSLTSPPGRPGDPVEVTVDGVAGGRVSPYLARRVVAGTVLRLGDPQGGFCLPEPSPRRLLLLSAGSGVTPVMGLLSGLAAADRFPDVVHHHSARDRGSVIFGPRLRALARQQPTYRLIERYTGHAGRLEFAQLDAICPDWRDRDVWACGPEDLLDDAEKHWADAGLPDALHVERFRPPSFAAPDADGGSVAFSGSGRIVHAAAGRPLLEVGEAAGVAMPSGCRMGICFSCVAPLRAGQVRDLRTGEVHGDEGELVQTCVSAAAGDCEIEL